MQTDYRCINALNNLIECPTPGGWEWWQYGLLIGGICLAIIVILSLIWSLAIAPRYNVWAQHQAGLADLARARNEQQVQVADAQGRLDAAQINKKAAVIEAEGVALQIQTIGEKLTTHDLYLKWQWIKMMEEGDHSVIYVPTEANLPILEAGRTPK